MIAAGQSPRRSVHGQGELRMLVRESIPGVLPAVLTLALLAAPEFPGTVGRTVWEYETGG